MMTEELTCPYCFETLRSSRSASLPDTTNVTCKKCNCSYSLGEARSVQLPKVQRQRQEPKVIVQHVHHYHGNRSSSGSLDTAAVIVSLFIPGLGHMIKGQILNGICWFFVVLIGYAMLVVPGIVLHIMCIIGAARVKRS